MEHDLVRVPEAEGAQQPVVVGELGDRGRDDVLADRREHDVLPGMGRDPHSGRAHEAAQAVEAVREDLPPRERVRRMRPERDQIRRQPKDLDPSAAVPAKDRLESTEVCIDELGDSLVRDVREPCSPSGRRAACSRRRNEADPGHPRLHVTLPSASLSAAIRQPIRWGHRCAGSGSSTSLVYTNIGQRVDNTGKEPLRLPP